MSSRTPLPTDALTIRPYLPSDEAAAIELWRLAWQEAYPAVDFSSRLEWWGERWRRELVATATVLVAETASELVGFVTVDTSSGYLDQIVVAPQAWGRGVAAELLAQARRLSPRGITLHVNTDNLRAIRFYEKHGFRRTGEDRNPLSGAPVQVMRWP